MGHIVCRRDYEGWVILEKALERVGHIAEGGYYEGWAMQEGVMKGWSYCRRGL